MNSAIIWILAAAVLFVAYCKKQGKTPAEVLGVSGKLPETVNPERDPSLAEPQSPSPERDLSLAEPQSPSPERENPEIEDETYRAMYMITGSNRAYYVSYSNVLYLNNANGKRIAELSLDGTKAKQCTALVERLAADIANQPEDFDLSLYNQFDNLSSEALKFCWIYFHLKGYTIEDINGDEYLMESISQIETDALQKQRKNWSRWATLIRKNRQTLDALINYELA